MPTFNIIAFCVGFRATKTAKFRRSRKSPPALSVLCVFASLRSNAFWLRPRRAPTVRPSSIAHSPRRVPPRFKRRKPAKRPFRHRETAGVMSQNKIRERKTDRRPTPVRPSFMTLFPLGAPGGGAQGRRRPSRVSPRLLHFCRTAAPCTARPADSSAEACKPVPPASRDRDIPSRPVDHPPFRKLFSRHSQLSRHGPVHEAKQHSSEHPSQRKHVETE